jgi:GTP cyclohydrolase III
MSGWSTTQIAGHIQRPYSWVSGVLKDPTVREIIASLMEEVDDQLAALFPLAVSTIRRVMETGSDGAAIKAAETVLRSQGKIQDQGRAGDTAEDVIARIMARVEVEGKAIVSIGIGTNGRSPSANAHPNLRVIDGSPEPPDSEGNNKEEDI